MRAGILEPGSVVDLLLVVDLQIAEGAAVAELVGGDVGVVVIPGFCPLRPISLLSACAYCARRHKQFRLF